MTIKPVVVASTAKRVGGSNGDKDVEARSKDTHAHTHATHGGQVVVVDSGSNLVQQNVRSATSHSHSHRNVNVVIDGQSPQRRGEVYDELARHRRSPHKSSRSKRRDHEHHGNKRDRCDRDKHVGGGAGVVPNKCSSPHVASGVNNVVGVGAGGGSGGGSNNSNVGVVNGVGSSVGVAVGSVGSSSAVGGKSPEHLSGLPAVMACQSPKAQSTAAQAAANALKSVEERYSGYNSGDEHLQPKEGTITADEWQRRDEQFAKCMADSGYVLKPVEEDGACLFRAISLQIYGDEEMHDVIRQHTMDYIYKNREYFCHFVTEDINNYIKRKRRTDSHGNHIEVQAISEIYSRPVEVYCYKPTPINIFNSEQLNNGYAPLRLSYQRGSHYNAIIDPYNATVGVGLGLAGYKPELQTKDAVRLSEQLEIEQTMFEDKLKTTDWEATNEAIEEQIARESYLQWCRDNLQKSRAASASTSATVTSAEAAATDAEASPSKYSTQHMQKSTCSSDNNSSIGGISESSTLTSDAIANLNEGNNNFNAKACNVGGGGGISGGNGVGGCGAIGDDIGNISIGGGACSATSSVTLLEHTFPLSPKSLSALAHNLKKDATCDLGFDSDDTDLSSTSSMGNYGIGGGGTGKKSPTGNAARPKKSKNRNSTVRNTKKRRRDQNINPAGLVTRSETLNSEAVPMHKSPRRESPPLLKPAIAADKCTRSRGHTPDAEQLPSTSKKSGTTPEKKFTNVLDATKNATTTSTKEPLSSFYQELLEASYATDGYGQLSESEMLQRAIQMSTQDYIEDQKRKYYYGP